MNVLRGPAAVHIRLVGRGYLNTLAGLAQPHVLRVALVVVAGRPRNNGFEEAGIGPVVLSWGSQ